MLIAKFHGMLFVAAFIKSEFLRVGHPQARTFETARSAPVLAPHRERRSF